MKKTKALQIIRTIKQNYNLIAKEWDASRFRPSGLKLKLLVGLKKGDQVLDAGCGNGLVAPMVLKAGGHYVGIDISRQLVAIAKKRFAAEVGRGAVEFKVFDITKPLPVARNSFDYVICFGVLHHIPTSALRQKVLNEFCRVLKPGGQAVILVWNLLNPWVEAKFKISDQFKAKPARLDDGDIYVPWRATAGCVIKRYVHLFTVAEWRALLAKTPFKKTRFGFYTRSGQAKNNAEELAVRLVK